MPPTLITRDVPGYESSLGRPLEAILPLIRVRLRRICQPANGTKREFYMLANMRIWRQACEIHRLRVMFGLNKKTEVITLKVGDHILRIKFYPKLLPDLQFDGPLVSSEPFSVLY